MKISQYIFSVLLCQALLVSNYAQNCSKTVNVFFDFDKDNVKAQYEDELLDEIDAIGVDNITSIEISGHTDSKGSIEYNIDLANRRNKNVKEILPNSLIGILKENAHGELKPFEGATYKDDKRYQNNRRVEVLIKYVCGGTDIENTPQSIAQREKDQQQLNAFLASNEPITEVITFDNKEDQLLKTDQGTTLFVPANSFINSDGTVPE
ncbi:MAG: OmpA family protein, partial [Flavobacteriales bacterium]|nr:OmpA family protein [Flavobacteriales bacterium]